MHEALKSIYRVAFIDKDIINYKCTNVNINMKGGEIYNG